MPCTVNGCDHSVTSAHADYKIDNNGTWSDGVQFGTPGDFTWTLTGQTFSMAIKRNRYDAVALLQVSTSNGRIITDDVVQRVIHFNVDSADIQANLDPGIYVYDLLMEDASTPPIVVPMMHGTIEVVQGVTQP